MPPPHSPHSPHPGTSRTSDTSSIRLESFADNAAANSFYEACGWLHGDRLTGEGPAKVEYIKISTSD